MTDYATDILECPKVRPQCHAACQTSKATNAITAAIRPMDTAAPGDHDPIREGFILPSNSAIIINQLVDRNPLVGMEKPHSRATQTCLGMDATYGHHDRPKITGCFRGGTGPQVWSDRVARLAGLSASQRRVSRNLLQRHCIEVTIERLRRQPLSRLPSVAELTDRRICG